MKATANTPKTAKLEKSIEVSKRRISDYEKKIEMYRTRFEKNNKYGLDLSALRFDYDGTKETHQAITRHNDEVEKGWYNVYVKELGENDGFWAYCKVKDAASYFIDNHYNLKREQRNLAELENQIAQANAIIAAQKEQEENPEGLRKVLVEILADFKVEWYKRMREWFSNSYDRLWEKKPFWKGWVERKRELTRKYRHQLGKYDGTHRRLRDRLDNYEEQYRKLLCSRELLYDDKAEYMSEVEKDLDCTWNYGINVFVEKCEGYNVDIDKIEISRPKVTNRGFEAILTDGKPRVIDIRSIWAAEYSDYVRPHTRYIVTERKRKVK